MPEMHHKMGLQYWSQQALLRDDPQEAAELAQAAESLDLAQHLVTVIRKGYHADQFDAETLVVLAQLESHLESKDALDVRE